MSQRRGRLFGLDSQLKAGVIATMRARPGRGLAPTVRRLDDGDGGPATAPRRDFTDHPLYRDLALQRVASERLGIANPFFRVHDGAAGHRTSIDGRSLINFASYNYLDLVEHPRVRAAAAMALERYGPSASASRPVGGERAVHATLEDRLATLYASEAAVAFVSGHGANVSVIGKLFGGRDLVVHDALSHNSVVVGAELSGAARRAFSHNDPAACERVLRDHRGRAERALIAIEGLYSMDGDIPDLAAFVALARRYDAYLMVDEAHAVGVLGATGRGLAEEQGIDPSEVDIWMGTLSKSFAGCGGYIAGSRTLVELLKFAAPGFLYSVGMAPPLAAASAAAVDVMLEEGWRVERLRRNGRHLLDRLRAHGLDTGTSAGFSVVPVIVRSSVLAARLSNWLFERGVNVQPILYPAVEERAARLRFFVTSGHELDELETAAALTASGLEELDP